MNRQERVDMKLNLKLVYECPQLKLSLSIISYCCSLGTRAGLSKAR